eukprot:m.9481 g.9481  ORF g.9481 m.9481 type:complete len:75 (+) comp21383_c0_seq1:902-1126(+)
MMCVVNNGSLCTFFWFVMFSPTIHLPVQPAAGRSKHSWTPEKRVKIPNFVKGRRKDYKSSIFKQVKEKTCHETI